jgi:iron(III) transport system substrate-binding protein
MSTQLRKIGAMAAGFSIALSVASCGASPVESGGDSAAGGSGTSLQAVYDSVEGLTGTERKDRLVELAQEAGGEVGWYYVGKMDPLIEAFEEQTGLSVAAYQGISEDLAERVGQEHTTNQQGSDLVLGAAVDLRTMDGEGLLGELKSPSLDDADEGYKGFNAISPYANITVLAYNNDLIPPDQQPSSYEELYRNPPGNMGIEMGDWQWYENLVRKYFMEQKGMSEQDAIDLITNGLRGAQQVEGHSLLVELLAGGQYGGTPTAFAHTIEPLVEAQSPIAYGVSSAETPPILLTNAMALTQGGPNPAGGLVLLEWLMGAEGQQMFADMNYAPTSNAYTGPSVLDKFPNSIVADLFLTDSPEDIRAWQGKYQELLQSIGGKPAS